MNQTDDYVFIILFMISTSKWHVEIIKYLIEKWVYINQLKIIVKHHL